MFSWPIVSFRRTDSLECIHFWCFRFHPPELNILYLVMVLRRVLVLLYDASCPGSVSKESVWIVCMFSGLMFYCCLCSFMTTVLSDMLARVLHKDLVVGAARPI